MLHWECAETVQCTWQISMTQQKYSIQRKQPKFYQGGNFEIYAKMQTQPFSRIISAYLYLLHVQKCSMSWPVHCRVHQKEIYFDWTHTNCKHWRKKACLQCPNMAWHYIYLVAFLCVSVTLCDHSEIGICALCWVCIATICLVLVTAMAWQPNILTARFHNLLYMAEQHIYENK